MEQGEKRGTRAHGFRKENGSMMCMRGRGGVCDSRSRGCAPSCRSGERPRRMTRQALPRARQFPDHKRQGEKQNFDKRVVNVRRPVTETRAHGGGWGLGQTMYASKRPHFAGRDLCRVISSHSHVVHACGHDTILIYIPI